MDWNRTTTYGRGFDAFLEALRIMGSPDVRDVPTGARIPDLVNCMSCHGYCSFDPETKTFITENLCPCCTDTCKHWEKLRAASFTDQAGRQLVVEEVFVNGGVETVIYEQKG